MTQKELAAAAGIQIAYMSNLERNFSANKKGVPRPSVDLVERFSKVLDIPLDEARLAAGYAPQGAANQVRVSVRPGIEILLSVESFATDTDIQETIEQFEAFLIGKEIIRKRKAGNTVAEPRLHENDQGNNEAVDAELPTHTESVPNYGTAEEHLNKRKSRHDSKTPNGRSSSRS